MIVRVYAACPGCDAPTLLRVGIAVTPGERQPFYLRCPQCASAIRGQLLTTEDATVSVQLDEAQVLPEDASNDWQVITTHPAFPFIPGTEASPFIDVTHALGDATMPYFQVVGEFNGLATQEWRQLERAFQFYLTEEWERLDMAMSRLLADNWPEEPTMMERHDLIHRLLTVMIVPLDLNGSYSDVQKEIWERAEPSQELIDYLRQTSFRPVFLHCRNGFSARSRI